ncbi:hypothetical protein DQT32_04755 [Salmonella enterica subsp. enterica serovar Braenderup]|nr:hypothetical protein [Salmonella enterica subsp. enterica serovar Braenderup]
MGKPIAGVYKLPFGTTGIIVQGAKLADGTLLKNLRIVKQRSSTQFDLIDVSTNIVHQKITITGFSSTGSVLDPTLTDDAALALIKDSTFFIRVLDENDDPVGYCTKLYSNLVHMSNGESFFVPDYDMFYAPVPPTTAPVYAPTGAPAAFTKVGKPNELMIGTGNSNQSMVTATDGVIQLAMAARLWQPQSFGAYNPVVVPVNSTYTIHMDASKKQEFTIPFSIGITASPFIGKITDLYDVTMTFYGNPNGLMTSSNISWHLEFNNGKYILKDYKFGRDIIDSAVNSSLTAIQNIQRYKFYQTNFLDVIPPVGSVPTGNFIGVITARNLVTNEVLELKVGLDASYI